MDIGAVIGKYIELRDRKAVLAEKQQQEMQPLSDAMDQIENWLMHQMNTTGVDQLKANGVGTAFKKDSTSCQMQDPVVFKGFIFHPAVEGVVNYLRSAGHELRDVDAEVISQTLRDLARWDMVDFRAGKKGIQEFMSNENAPVPGVAVNTVATISVRRA